MSLPIIPVSNNNKLCKRTLVLEEIVRNICWPKQVTDLTRIQCLRGQSSWNLVCVSPRALHTPDILDMVKGRNKGERKWGRKEGKKIVIGLWFGSTSFWTRSVTKDWPSPAEFPEPGCCAQWKFSQKSHTLLLTSHTRCVVQGRIIPVGIIPVGSIHMWGSRREHFRAGWSTLSYAQCSVPGIQKHFPDGIIKSARFCKAPSHFWEIAPCFSFPLVILELLSLAINATLKLEGWVGYLLYIMKNIYQAVSVQIRIVQEYGKMSS